MSGAGDGWIDRARAAARVAFRSGLAFDARPSALVELARVRLAGPLGLPALAERVVRGDDPPRRGGVDEEVRRVDD